MARFLLHGHLRRSRRVNMLGMALLFFLLLVLVASLFHGVRTLVVQQNAGVIAAAAKFIPQGATEVGQRLNVGDHMLKLHAN